MSVVTKWMDGGHIEWLPADLQHFVSQEFSPIITLSGQRNGGAETEIDVLVRPPLYKGHSIDLCCIIKLVGSQALHG